MKGSLPQICPLNMRKKNRGEGPEVAVIFRFVAFFLPPAIYFGYSVVNLSVAK